MRARNRPLQVKRIGVEESFGEDIYHRLLRMTWPRFCGLVILIYLGLNMLFAGLYWLSPGSIAEIAPGDLFSCFSFSVETFSTIGYGHFYPISAYAHNVVTIEAATSLLSTALLTGIIFAKFSHASARVVFSNNILWTKQNGVPMLALRLGNVRANRVFEGRAKMTLLRDEVTQEGEQLKRLLALKLVRDESPLFSLSWTIYHIIDETSPFSGMTLEKTVELGWEIIVTFVGLDQDMSQHITATIMYSAGQIVRARKFADMIHTEEGTRVIDFSKLNEIEA